MGVSHIILGIWIFVATRAWGNSSSRDVKTSWSVFRSAHLSMTSMAPFLLVLTLLFFFLSFLSSSCFFFFFLLFFFLPLSLLLPPPPPSPSYSLFSFFSFSSFSFSSPSSLSLSLNSLMTSFSWAIILWSYNFLRIFFPLSIHKSHCLVETQNHQNKTLSSNTSVSHSFILRYTDRSDRSGPRHKTQGHIKDVPIPYSCLLYLSSYQNI